MIGERFGSDHGGALGFGGGFGEGLQLGAGGGGGGGGDRISRPGGGDGVTLHLQQLGDGGAEAQPGGVLLGGPLGPQLQPGAGAVRAGAPARGGQLAYGGLFVAFQLEQNPISTGGAAADLQVVSRRSGGGVEVTGAAIADTAGGLGDRSRVSGATGGHHHGGEVAPQGDGEARGNGRRCDHHVVGRGDLIGAAGQPVGVVVRVGHGVPVHHQHGSAGPMGSGEGGQVAGAVRAGGFGGGGADP